MAREEDVQAGKLRFGKAAERWLSPHIPVYIAHGNNRSARVADIKAILAAAKENASDGQLSFDPTLWTFENLEAKMRKMAVPIRQGAAPRQAAAATN